MQEPRSPSRPFSPRLALLLFASASAGSCVSTFDLDLPPDHPACVTAPSGGALNVPDPAAVPEQIEAVSPANEMQGMGSDEDAMHPGRAKEQR